LIDVKQLVAQLVCFLLVFILLRKFLWKTFLKILDDRKERIAGELRQIDQTKNEVAGIKADFEGKLKDIDAIAAARAKEAVKKGQEAAEDIKDRARIEAQRIVSTAKAEIEQTVIKTKEELRRQVVDLTIMATEKILEEKMTSEVDRQLAQKFVTQLEEKDA